MQLYVVTLEKIQCCGIVFQVQCYSTMGSGNGGGASRDKKSSASSVISHSSSGYLTDQAPSSSSLNRPPSTPRESAPTTPTAQLPSNTQTMAQKPPLKTRPSVIIGNIRKDQEKELEDNVVLKKPALKVVFKGFLEAEQELAKDKDRNNFAKLSKLLHDKVLTQFEKYSKDDERTVMANKLASNK